MANRTKQVSIKCPDCGSLISYVVDSRAENGERIYRRRRCLNGHRFSTEERVVNLSRNNPEQRK